MIIWLCIRTNLVKPTQNVDQVVIYFSLKPSNLQFGEGKGLLMLQEGNESEVLPGQIHIQHSIIQSSIGFFIKSFFLLLLYEKLVLIIKRKTCYLVFCALSKFAYLCI